MSTDDYHMDGCMHAYTLMHTRAYTHTHTHTHARTVVERPQHMLMRVALGIHKEDIDAAIEVIES